MKSDPVFLGIDTSNYTTSCAWYDTDTGRILQKKQLLPVAEKYREYKKALADKEDYALLMDSADDADMKEEARAEYAAAT